ncbi:hypothetical protein DRW03_20570 [Corallococcus sp. H22C18031201]|nr:hypothetical protein DRW03_20570 [Corallococcus sp. H22C18031201]
MSDSSDYGQGPGTPCPVHPDRGAKRACGRCGNFMCDICSERGMRSLCLACREREGFTAFPLNRSNWTIGSLWELCWAAFQREWGMLSVAALILMGVSGGAQMFMNLVVAIGGASNSVALTVVLTLIVVIAQMLVQGLVQLGFLRVAFDVLHGRSVDLARLFSQMNKLVHYAMTMIVMMLVLFIPALLLISGGAVAVMLGMGGVEALRHPATLLNNPGMLIAVTSAVGVLGIIVCSYLLLPLYLLQPELAFCDDPPSPLEVLQRCWRYADGQRLRMLGVCVLMVVISLVGLLACCVGLIPAMALIQVLFAGMYLAVSREAEDLG